ncbi:MAG: hypothetical protein ARM1_0292 [Candidatus Micrarchaeota archaeon]|nr:MAG: hypothetical protein ARM1_0292 [Candidatus Micrarchaeota archaeon]
MAKLLIDAMHINLGRWLRLLGVKTVIPENFDDNYLLSYSKRLKLILVTADKQLYQRAVKRGINAFYVKQDDVAYEIAYVMHLLRKKISFSYNNSYCSICGNKLTPIGRIKAKRLNIHSDLLKRYERFLLCKHCNKIYWEGSHWKNINRVIEEAKSYERLLDQ